MCRTALLYLGQVAAVNENLLNKGEIKKLLSHGTHCLTSEWPSSRHTYKLFINLNPFTPPPAYELIIPAVKIIKVFLTHPGPIALPPVIRFTIALGLLK